MVQDGVEWFGDTSQVINIEVIEQINNTGVDVVEACDSYTWIDGITYNQSNNTATYTTTNQAGGDSVITLNLTIYPTPNVDLGQDTTICYGVSQLILDAGIADEYLWSDGSVNQTLLVDNSILGETIYYVSATNGNLCEATDSIVVNTEICSDIINEIENNDDISLYPNPTSSFLHIESGNLKIENIEIYNVTGAIATNIDNVSNTIDVSNLDKGIYLLSIKTNKHTYIKYFVKK